MLAAKSLYNNDKPACTYTLGAFQMLSSRLVEGTNSVSP